MVSAMISIVFLALLDQVFAGEFIGKIKVEYNTFTIIEGDDFQFKCTAEHEDKRPQLRWYFVDPRAQRTNITNFSDSGGKGNTATSTRRETNARLESDTGDYFCEARVDDEIKSSIGIPIQVIEKKNEPKVKITRSVIRGKIRLTCSVVPNGRGDLIWRKDGSRIKEDENVNELVLESPSRDRYYCFGNLTLGGYKFFSSSAYATGAAWSYMKTQPFYLLPLLTSLFTLTNLLSF